MRNLETSVMLISSVPVQLSTIRGSHWLGLELELEAQGPRSGDSLGEDDMDVKDGLGAPKLR